jgi:hypothetical protein
MTPPPSALGELGAAIRAWATVALIVFGGIGAWFNLSAKVEQIELRHAEWREAQTAALAQLTKLIQEQGRETRQHALDLAVIKTGNDAIRDQLRRLDQRAERAERQGFAPAAREVP